VTTALALESVRGADGRIDAARLRRAYGRFPTGVTLLAVLDGGRPAGFAASSFNTVSADPPLVAVSIQTTSSTWPRLAAAPRLGVSVLADDQGALARRMAAPGDRFSGVEWRAEGGAVFLAGAAAWFDCALEHVLVEGDHLVAILRVERDALDESKQPLVFGDSRFHRAVEIAPPGERRSEEGWLDTVHELELGWW